MNERRYQVVTWSSDIGTDERMDYNDESDAIDEAQRYKGREEYAAVYDRQTKTAVVVFGNPFTPVFCDYVTIKEAPRCMKIYFFDLDPETGIYKAGCTDETGKRFTACIWATGGRSYVSTGSRRTGNHRVFWFSEEQSRELTRFMNSGEYSREFSEGIA